MGNSSLDRLRALLAEADAAGIILTSTDNVYWASGYSSVMDGWHLREPLSGVFVPADPKEPVTLLLPEASLIGLIVSARAGYPVRYDRLACFDLLSFCEAARAEDAYVQLGPDIERALGDLSAQISVPCAANIVAALAAVLGHHKLLDKRILCDDLRVAAHLGAHMATPPCDGYDLIFRARSIKSAAEIDVFKQSGVKADKVMDFTVSQLGRGKKWCNIEKAVAHFMIDEDIDPLPSSPMLFGGSYDLAFRPDLFRTHHDQPFEDGQIAILETQGRYKNVWIDINRTAHIGTPSAEYREQHEIVQQCFREVSEKLVPGNNSAEICAEIRRGTARQLDAPGKLLMIVHSIGHVPLENPVPFPFMGLESAHKGFTIEPDMVLSFDCLYFGSKLGPSHMENVLIISQNASASIYNYPLDLIIA